MGELLRRYWHPVAVNVEITERPTKRVRVLGEDLVLYRDTSEGLGLIGPRCAHRGVDLVYGMPEPNGLRCPYHGWLYDATGQRDGGAFRAPRVASRPSRSRPLEEACRSGPGSSG